ncbi:hypothetical protein DOM22_15045 [Bdellovibrio sp. ZAP7]|uniref:hypothetical protein n=1 Tax=Bdellovibrio sp. ZAP7 TaxID=2231053 RepID=UPI00115792EF|nr:hypothetical protein [Bdellovibrio sp. ZAP7]QDK46387.1 hypothetical protein DOM22_15045 [Bdellovibrio sp. ZAP7]
MKKALILTLIFTSIGLKAAAVSADDSLVALQKAEQIIATLPTDGEFKKNDPQSKKLQKDQDKAFDILTDAIKSFKESPEDQLLLEQILKVVSAMNKKDPTRYATEMVSELFNYELPEFKDKQHKPLVAKIKKRQEQYQAALKKLPPKEANELHKAIQNFVRSANEGNG